MGDDAGLQSHSEHLNEGEQRADGTGVGRNLCVCCHDDQKERTWARFRVENVHQTISEGINAEIK